MLFSRLWLAFALSAAMAGISVPARAERAAVFHQIEAGSFHACGIEPGGAVRCWGANDVGQLGRGGYRDHVYARPVRGMFVPATDLSAGESHSCAVTRLHRIRCWGRGVEGQLGDGDRDIDPVAVPLAGPRRWEVRVTAGYTHGCAITAAGTARCWGANGFGELGNGTHDDQLQPVAVSGLERGQRQIGAGAWFSCALDRRGAVRCWGFGGAGRLGQGDEVDSALPVVVRGLASGGAQLAVGVHHACVLDEVGRVRCWGGNDFGQVGGPQAGAAVLEPFEVPGLPAPVIAVAAGGGHSCAIAGPERQVLCWGWNLQGQLGDGGSSDSAVPVAVQGLPGGAVSVTLGDLSSCALMDSGEAWCWGGNDRGQLGRGGTVGGPVPAPVLVP